MQSFTLGQLRRFDGRRGGPIYVAVASIVYDVSAVQESKKLYGPGCPYSVFAGRECARALACMEVRRALCNADLRGLDESQTDTLQMWVERFSAKYPVVGKVRKPRWPRISPIIVAGALIVASVVINRGSNSLASGCRQIQSGR